MAGIVRVSAAGRNGMLDALRELLHGGTLELYTGTPPTAPETPIGAQVLLGTLALGDPVAPAAYGGVLTFAAITDDAAADASGDATWARLYDTAGAPLIDLPVGAVGSGSAIEMDTTTVAAGQPLKITSATLSIPADG